MKEMKYLPQYAPLLEKCVSCGQCQATCPTYKVEGDESMVARGKMNLIDAAIKGEIEMTPRWLEKMSLCTSCLACGTNCPNAVSPAHIITAAKAEYYRSHKRKLLPSLLLELASRKALLNLLFKLGGLGIKLMRLLPDNQLTARLLPYFRDGRKRFLPNMGERHFKQEVPETFPPKDGGTLRALFFTGCMVDHVFYNVGMTAVNSLVENGVEVIVPKQQVCCGAPFYFNGDFEKARESALENLRVFEQYDVGHIFSHCATCGDVLKEIYPLLFAKEPEILERLTSFTARIIDFNKLYRATYVERRRDEVAREGKRLRVTWHDPCHLKRGLGVSKEPREILKSLPRVEFVEMEGADECCGGAGSFSLYHYDVAMEIGGKKVQNIIKSGADIVVTGCPSCQMQIQDCLNRADSQIKVLHTSELIALQSE